MRAVDVLAVLDAVPDWLILATVHPANENLRGSALKVREARAAVAELIESAAALDERTTCMVAVAPCTIFGVGVKISTIVAAIKRRAEWGDGPHHFNRGAQAKIAPLDAGHVALLEALEFYANEANWTSCSAMERGPLVDEDGGDKARAALANIGAAP